MVDEREQAGEARPTCEGEVLACGRHIGTLSMGGDGTRRGEQGELGMRGGRGADGLTGDEGKTRRSLAFEDVGVPLTRLRLEDLQDSLTGERLSMSVGRDLFDDGTMGLLTPDMSGCGIMSCPTLVPETIMLVMTPRSCSRHASTLSIRDRYRSQVFFLDICEEDIVMGTYTDRLIEAAGRILELLPCRPRAVFVCGSCIDDLLGTDMRGLCEELSGIHGIPFSWLYIDPIARSATPPPIRMKKAIFRLLEEGPRPQALDPCAVNIIGEFAQLTPDSELPGMLARAGYEQVRQVATCRTYDDFYAMREASANIAVMRMARGAAVDMQRKLGIPFHVMRPSVLPEKMAALYGELGAFLGKELDWSEELAHTEAYVNEARASLAGVRVAVSARGGTETLEAAILLARAGTEVVAVVTDEIERGAWPLVGELCRMAPQARIVPTMRPEMLGRPEMWDGVDVTVGMDAAQLFPQARFAQFAHGGEPLGFAQTRALVRDVKRALTRGRTGREVARTGEQVGVRRTTPAWPPTACKGRA